MDLNDFESARPRLLAVATRMLGSASEAEEAVQEAWLRADRTDGDAVENPTAWLTTVVSRICLDTLRARRDTATLDEIDVAAPDPEPDETAEAAEAVGAALGVVLDTLGPAERVAFVLHDVFAVPFDDVAAILGKSPAATRKVASRARQRVTGAPAEAPARTDTVRAFLAASRDGDFTGLVDLLDPDAVFRTHVEATDTSVLVGASAIADAFMFRAKTAVAALVDGLYGYAVPAPGAADGAYLLFADLTFTPEGRIASIDAILRPEEVEAVDIVAV